MEGTILTEVKGRSTTFAGTWWKTTLGHTVCVDSKRRIVAASSADREDVWSSTPSAYRRRKKTA